jgi:hypothetical protein
MTDETDGQYVEAFNDVIQGLEVHIELLAAQHLKGVMMLQNHVV